jgi:hypothetical protein
LVCFNTEHNEANGENNSDGISDNLSWNCGVEGDSGDPNIDSLRNRQIRNFMAILLLSRGVPMFVSGDEIRRSQKGNNNAYCHDSDINWFDWSLVERHADIRRFFDRSLRLAEAARIPPARIILDPGIGFGKSRTQNFMALANLAALKHYGLPILVGVSRKSLLAEHATTPVDKNLVRTLAANLAAAARAGAETIATAAAKISKNIIKQKRKFALKV